MLMDLFTNKKIWTIIFTLLMLFAIVNGLRYVGLYEGMENSTPVVDCVDRKQITTTYDF
jgi:hypothetical protein